LRRELKEKAYPHIRHEFGMMGNIPVNSEAEALADAELYLPRIPSESVITGSVFVVICGS